jgi:SAM-dependent methyltransferase
MQSPSLLEIGCGPAIKTRELLASNCSEVVLMDQPETRSLVARSFPASAFHGLDLESANLELDREFDMILCADVLEHLTNPTPCLELISRHMAKSSIAVLSTPERDNLRGDACTACLKSDHVREWNAREFRRYVESLGFEVIEQCLCPQVRQSIFRHLTRWASGNAQRRAVWLGCQVITVRLEQSAMRRNP